MQYALLIYGTDEAWEAMDRDEVMARHEKFQRMLAERGAARGGQELATTAEAREGEGRVPIRHRRARREVAIRCGGQNSSASSRHMSRVPGRHTARLSGSGGESGTGVRRGRECRP